MSKIKIQQSLTHLENAFAKLDEALKVINQINR